MKLHRYKNQLGINPLSVKWRGLGNMAEESGKAPTKEELFYVPYLQGWFVVVVFFMLILGIYSQVINRDES